MANINHKNDLPQWFKLENYSGTKEFGPLQWYEQLYRRQSLLRSIDYKLGDALGQTYEEKLWRIHTAQQAASMRLRPLEAIPVVGLAYPNVGPISNLRVVDLMKQADRDRDAAKFGLCASSATQRWRVIRNPQASYEQHAELSRMPIMIDSYDVRRPRQAVIRVNLGATDTTLRASFKEWLKLARSAEVAELENLAALNVDGPGREPYEPEDKTKDPKFKEWTRYGILPYLDLAIWAMETDNNITDPVYAEAICDGYFRGEGSLRSTTHKRAVELMRDLSKLEVLATVQ